MAKSLDILALFEGHIAAGADLIAGVAGLGAGRVLGVNELGIVAESGNGLLSGEDLLADRADSALGHAGLGAGGSLCLNVNGGVIDHLGLLAGLHDFAAELADDIAGVAFLCAGCFLDVCELVGCDVLGLLSGSIVFNAVSIAERLIVIYKLILAALGALIDRNTGVVAVCGNELGLDILVARMSYDLAFSIAKIGRISCSANAALLYISINHTVLGAGCIFLLIVDPSVAELLYSAVRNNSTISVDKVCFYFTFTVEFGSLLVAAIFGAGGSYSLFNCPSGGRSRNGLAARPAALVTSDDVALALIVASIFIGNASARSFHCNGMNGLFTGLDKFFAVGAHQIAAVITNFNCSCCYVLAVLLIKLNHV